MDNRAVSILGVLGLLLSGCGSDFDNNLIVGKEKSNTQVQTTVDGGESSAAAIPDAENYADAKSDASNDSGRDVGSGGNGGTSGIAPITSDGGVQVETAPEQCEGQVASQVFRYALCSCNDTAIVGTLMTDAFDSDEGPYTAESALTGAAAGFNGKFQCSPTIDIGGSLTVAGDQGLNSVGSLRVLGDLRVQGLFSYSPHVEVANNCWLASGLQGAGDLHIAGSLIMPTTASVNTLPGYVTVDGNTLSQPVTVQPPCACGDNEIVNVAEIIANGKAHNDNAQTGFNADILSAVSGVRVELPARTFVTSISSFSVNDPFTLVVDQKTSLFVEGDFFSVGKMNLEIGPHGELDMYIGGNLSLAGGTVFGDPNRPSKFRVYVAGDQQIVLTGNTWFAGNLYAPRATVTMIGGQTFYGSLFAGTIASSVTTVIHYDSAIIREGDDCLTPDRCDSCTDCEATLGCVDGQCGACRADTDCCAPLVCVNGQCGTLLL